MYACVDNEDTGVAALLLTIRNFFLGVAAVAVAAAGDSIMFRRMNK